MLGRALLAGLALAALLPLPAAAVSEQNVSAAVDWLAQPEQQAPDGSWGPSDDVKALYTSEVVVSLRELNRRGSSYFRGITWLENHSVSNTDYRSRQIHALASHGDNVAPALGILVDARRADPLGGGSVADGWGLSGAYAAAPLDTALALQALAEAGSNEDVQDALDHLKATQLAGGAGGWPAVAGGQVQDSIATAHVLRALLTYLAVDPTLADPIAGAVATLEAAVDASSPVLVQAHAALALLEEDPGSSAGSGLVAELAAAQQPDGSWGQNAYTTAVALRAIARELGLDAPALATPVFITDAMLRRVLNLALGRNAMDQITRGDLERIEVLDARGLGIESLTGLEAAQNLQFADLRDNGITDVGPIQGLPSLDTPLLQANPWVGLACDLNEDGGYGPADGLLVLRMIRDELTPTWLQWARADIAPQSGPGDGELTAADALLVLRAARGDSIAACADYSP